MNHDEFVRETESAVIERILALREQLKNSDAALSSANEVIEHFRARVAELERMIDLSDDGGVITALLGEIEKKDAALARIAELQSTIASNNYSARARIDLEHDNVTLWKERAEAALAKDALGAELIEWVANPGLHSKVCPQMCFFCGAKFPDEYEAHADGCLHIRARTILREATK